ETPGLIARRNLLKDRAPFPQSASHLCFDDLHGAVVQLGDLFVGQLIPPSQQEHFLFSRGKVVDRLTQLLQGFLSVSDPRGWGGPDGGHDRNSWRRLAGSIW